MKDYSWCDRVEEGVGVIECRGVSWRDRLYRKELL